MRSVAVTNAKGGVGKSTTAINLAAALAELDRRVLLIDADPSGNATLGFLPTGRPPAGLADVLLGERALADVIVPSGVENLHLVPPGDRLGACSDQMGGSQGLGHGREFRVRRIMRTLAGPLPNAESGMHRQDAGAPRPADPAPASACRTTDALFDVVLIDTSPVQTPLNVAILYAVDEVLIPIDPCVAALAGVRALEDLVRDVSGFRQELTDAGPLAIAGVLITRADRTLVSRQVEAEVRAYFGALVFDRAVPISVKFREAYARGMPLIHYDRLGPGAAAYRAAAEAFLQGARGDGQGSMRQQGAPNAAAGRGQAKRQAPPAVIPIPPFPEGTGPQCNVEAKGT